MSGALRDALLAQARALRSQADAIEALALAAPTAEPAPGDRYYRGDDHPFGCDPRSLKRAAMRLGFPIVRLERGRVAALREDVDRAVARSKSTITSTPANDADDLDALMRRGCSAPRSITPSRKTGRH